MRNIHLLALTVSGFALAAGIEPARAQSAATSAPSESAAPGDSAAGLEEVIVTATKRSESINDVGMAISALGAQTLENQRVEDVADLALITPGLSYAVSGFNTPVYTLRGVGFYETSLAAYPAVTVYVDEVPLSFPVLTTEAGLDVERVEILKGPQGTLFGQNSTGGAVNYIPRRSTETFEARMNLGYGRFNQMEVGGYISGPLSNSVSARLAFNAEHRDDWQRSYTRDDTLGERQNVAARLLVEAAPSENLRLLFNINGWINKDDLLALQYIASDFQLPGFEGLYPALENLPTAPEDPRAADWSPDFKPRGESDFYQGSLRMDYDVTNDVALTTLTSYQQYDRDNVQDFDGIVLHDNDLAEDHGYIESFFQEIRLANGSENALRWLFGANYEASDVDQDAFNVYEDASVVVLLFGPLFNHPVRGNPFYSYQEMRNAAAFSNFEYDLTGKVTLRAGARYTQADRKVEACGPDPGDGSLSRLYANIFVPAATGAAPIEPLLPGDCVVLDEVTYQPTVFRDELEEDNVSWRTGVDYSPIPDLLLYFNVAKGYKAGSYPATAATLTAQYRAVTQESLLDVDVGFKATLFGRRLQLDGAVYHYDYEDKQIRSFLIDPFTGRLQSLVNVPESSLTGVELNLAWLPVEGLSIGGGVSYVDAQVDEFVGIDGNGMTRDFAGERLPFTPEYSAALSVDYEWHLSGGLVASVGATGSHNSSTNSEIGGDDVHRIDAYSLLNLRAGIEPPSKRWRVSLWAKNVANEYYWTNIVTNFDTVLRYPGEPRTYGVSFSYAFN